jgi:uncharacterized protein YbjT (DUF2867 family)
VLVTGASGTIGRPLVPALVAAGHQVRAMTRSEAAAQTAAAAGAEPVHGDVTDPESLSAAVHGCDRAVQAANGTQMATVVIRSGWVWGIRKRSQLGPQPEFTSRNYLSLTVF